MSTTRTFATLGLFILDRFEYLDEDGRPTGRESEEQVGSRKNNLYMYMNKNALDRRWRDICCRRGTNLVSTPSDG